MLHPFFAAIGSPLVKTHSPIPVSGPWITQREIDYVTDAVKTAWYGDAGVYNQRFEQAFADYLSVRYAVSLPSCTSAIHLSLAALGIGPGDEVIVPECTWIASAAPITYTGATTVFADIDPRTWCLCPDSFAACLTPRTRAVIPVDLYGNVADYQRIGEIARRHGVAVIEDAAEAIGAEFHGRRAGSMGDTGVFSFHGSKTLTTGEGGMLVTDREDLYRRVLQLRDHGRKPGDKFFFNSEVGFKYKMTALQAALGLAQLERIDELITRKRGIFDWYRARLAAVPGITLNHEAPGTRSGYWMTTVILAPELGWRKEPLQEALARVGIDCRPFFHPLSSIPAYAETAPAIGARERNVNAYRVSPWGLNLPSALNLTEAQVDHVCTVLLELLKQPPVTV